MTLRLHLQIPLLLMLFATGTPILRFTSHSELILVPDNFSRIQDAIEAAKTGDTIYVREGTYPEYLTINKSIAISGENTSTTILAGNGTEILVKVTADDVKLSGFTLQNAETGILLQDADNSTIEENIIENMDLHSISTAGMGIYTINCRNILIQKNTLRKIYYNDIYFKKTNTSRVLHNTLKGSERWSQPVFMEYSHKNLVAYNQVLGRTGYIDGNEGGIGLLSSHYNTIYKNNIYFNEWCGISLQKSNHTHVESNNITKHAQIGIAIKNAYNTTIYHNNFVDNGIQTYISKTCNTTWDDGYLFGGNYWSHNDVTDVFYGRHQNKTGRDGIGDTPYIIDEQNIDNYPLMTPWGTTYQDVIADEYIGIDDIVSVAEHSPLSIEDSNWNPVYDMTKNGFVEMEDIVTVAEHFGENP